MFSPKTAFYTMPCRGPAVIIGDQRKVSVACLHCLTHPRSLQIKPRLTHVPNPTFQVQMLPTPKAAFYVTSWGYGCDWWGPREGEYYLCRFCSSHCHYCKYNPLILLTPKSAPSYHILQAHPYINQQYPGTLRILGDQGKGWFLCNVHFPFFKLLSLPT